ncbi:CG12885 [Drosophila busckii]|uniref:CG12885 n=1 Tax=Drosophila busckii TaxID=30019 RepID=A0A0M4F2C0_DROBS|nr:AF4/FMR2 family member 4 [Drosophila busckii]ALC45562.1 CG12885 [Drosophila busckii]
MLPQAELENYKLQVELLQEKLQRSEDNRQQLEHKLDKVLQKRSELDKCARHKTRQQYQAFLEDQTKRNERNKKLVQVLERIDDQTAAMSQRSERLKMMKLQYQMYFAKLVQSQTLRRIQQTATPAANIVLLPPPPPPTATQVNATPTAAAPLATALPNAADQVTAQTLLAAPQPQQWAYAMTTPTPTHAGMLLAPAPATAAAVYMPMAMPMHYSLPGQQSQPLATSNLFDLRATLRALDNESVDLPERMTHFDAAALAAEYQKISHARAAAATPTPTPTATTVTTASSSSRDKDARELGSIYSTQASSSSLAFDKLPKMATLTELPTAVASYDDVGGQPQMAAEQQQQQQPPIWAPNSRVTKGEHEKSPNVAAHYEPGQHQQQQQQQRNFEAYFGELKIDEPWQPPATTTTITTAARPREDKLELNVRAGEPRAGGSMAMGGGLAAAISNDLLDEVKASRAALEAAAAAVDEQLARGNQLSPTAANEPHSKPRVSIENIENAIYGERLTAAAAAAAAAATATTSAAAAVAAAAAMPTQGLFENLASNAPQQQQLQQHHVGEVQQVIDPLPEQQQQSQIDYAQYDAHGYGESAEPTYASIESSQQQQLQPQLQQQQPSDTVEPLYSEIGNPTDYQQYAATDANAAAEVEAAAAAAAAAQQEYSNIDYGNYDAAQYAAAGYDPNAYPGYIYDETTGQYIADPNAPPYAADGSYAGQEYDAGATNYDYYAEQSQQQQQQQLEQQEQQEQQEAAYPMADNNNSSSQAADLLLPQEVGVSPELAAADAKSEATHSAVAAAAAAAAKPVKPTSILATTDKQAAPNDAQQQQQPQQQQQQQQQKKKKRVNFVDSSETDDSSSAKPVPDVNSPATAAAAAPSAAAGAAATFAAPGATGSESDFDFSTGSEAKN